MFFGYGTILTGPIRYMVLELRLRYMRLRARERWDGGSSQDACFFIDLNLGLEFTVLTRIYLCMHVGLRLKTIYHTVPYRSSTPWLSDVWSKQILLSQFVDVCWKLKVTEHICHRVRLMSNSISLITFKSQPETKSVFTERLWMHLFPRLCVLWHCIDISRLRSGSSLVKN